ncbi:hypothetical protein D918_01506 [Trichuris suis]|nr:hypothetical protein D918_01506 [Trichuris suis]
MQFGAKHLLILFSTIYLHLKTEAPRSCPFENSALNYMGYRIGEKCFTLIQEHESTKRQKSENSELFLEVYCASNFKEGKLHYFDTTEGPSTDSWLPENTSIVILNKTNLFEAEGFICSHNPYEDCDAYEEQVCKFIKEKNACFLQNVQHVEQQPEMPYGMKCPNYTESDLLGPCKCTTCKYSQWTPWTQFIDKNGREVFTRYRPPSGEKWPCLADHKRCCAKIVIPRLGIHDDYPISEIMKRVTCAEGGRPIPELFHSKRCECEDQYNGVFCEIYTGGCITHQCKNGGTCIDHDSYYRCKCKRGFAGNDCEIQLTSDQIRAMDASPYQGAAMKFAYILCGGVALCIVLLILVRLSKPRDSVLLQMLLQRDEITLSSEASDEESSLLKKEEGKDGTEVK